ncbi:queuosine 5'-phosphate N-glycosylase/hydrolase [Dictyobacter formicarum]|nr:queuosine salvage family protein [Dictyobacter formicarum]
MSELTRWPAEEGDGSYTIQQTTDPLGILTSTRAVIDLAKNVWINTEHIEQLSKRWIQEDAQGQKPAMPLWDERYHFSDGTGRTVNWLLLLDALNFCFWAEKDQPRWAIEYQKQTLNGYWAEAAALKRAVEEGLPLWDAEYLRTISEETMAHIFRGSGTIPLFEQRVQNAREVGHVLLDRYAGQFTNAIEQAKRNAINLVLLLERDFPSFRDVAVYRGQPVRFLKRAQITVADINGSFHGQGWGNFTKQDQLTIFADYKLPQVLREYNVLEYEVHLAQKVDNKELIQAGSEEEIEIRACTIWACELLRQSLQRQGHAMTAAEIDMRLWLLGQRSEEMRPYHRTRTMYY